MFHTEPFIRLGETLENAIRTEDPAFTRAVEKSCGSNPWFTPENVTQAFRAICGTMLRKDALEEWLAAYRGPVSTPSDVGIVMAGNLPLVGFHDLLCVLLSGHRAWIKPSSKDRILTEYVVGLLKIIDPSLPVRLTDSLRSPDAVIATGSDLANRYFREAFGEVPRLLRGNRTSVAVLMGGETRGELEGLARDAFQYFGLGCRNVSRLFVPSGYDFTDFLEAAQANPVLHEGYGNAFRQLRAVLAMNGESFIDGGFFILRKNAGVPEALPDLLYSEYDAAEEVKEWIGFNREKLQCVVCSPGLMDGSVAFGTTQVPRPGDYADGRDTMDFLLNL